MNHAFIVLAISNKDVNIDGHFLSLIRRCLNSMKIDPNNNFYFLEIYPKAVGEENVSKLQQLFQNSEIKFNIKDPNIVPLPEQSNDNITHLIAIWNGKDNQIPNLILKYQRARKFTRFKIYDPNKYSMWSYINDADAICFATNGYFKKYGNNCYAVMGVGSALQARMFIPKLSLILGEKLKQFGNIPFVVGKVAKTDLISFPTKVHSVTLKAPELELPKYYLDKYNVNDTVPGYICKAQPYLICESLKHLAKLIEQNHYNKVILPRIGCGSGGLDFFKDVIPIFKNEETIKPHLDKLFIASFNKQPVPIKQYMYPKRKKKDYSNENNDNNINFSAPTEEDDIPF